MGHTIQTQSGCSKILSFNFEEVDFLPTINKELAKKQSSTALKGFRPGKAPLAMIKKFYGKEIEMKAIDTFIQEEIEKVVTQEDLYIVSQMEMKEFKMTPEIGPEPLPEVLSPEHYTKRNLSFSVSIEVFPEFTLPEFSDWSFTKESPLLEEKDFENYLNSILEKDAELKEVATPQIPVKEGHHVVINFEGEMANGEKPENMKGEEYSLEIGSKSFIPGFEEGIIGKTLEDKNFSIAVTFPEDYHMENLRNAPVTFHVTLLEIKEKVLPTLTEEFVKEKEFETVEDFLANHRTTARIQKKHSIEKKLQREILEKFSENTSIDLPDSMVQKQLTHDLKQKGIDSSLLKKVNPSILEPLKDQSKDSLKKGLIIGALAKKLNLSTEDIAKNIPPEELKIFLSEIAETSGYSLEETESAYNELPDVKNQFLDFIFERKLFDTLQEQMKITQL